MIETISAIFGNLWVVGPFRWAIYLIAVTSLLAWIAGHVERVSMQKDPPAWIRVVEYPVYAVTTLFSVILNLTLGWVFGPPTKDTVTFTKRLEDVLNRPSEYYRWQVTVAKLAAWWVDKLWMGHISGFK